MTKVLTTKDVAKRLRVKQDTLRNWRAAGKGPPFVQPAGPGTTPFYDPEGVEQFALEYRKPKRRKTNG